MSKTKVIAIFDIGKTNKKLLLFDEQLQLCSISERKFEDLADEDGAACDDILGIGHWLKEAISELLKNPHYELMGVNFSTYGASLVFLDGEGNRLTPLYNYLKEVPDCFGDTFYSRYGGKEEFYRRTASPDLGLLLNSGKQLLWLREKHPSLFTKVKSILHLPQYLSFLLTKEIVSEATSIGCHTCLWDFDRNYYHPWLADEGITLPAPLPNNLVFKETIHNRDISIGIGIHDSSASLVPYLRADSKKFILVSTGTWCINMNPFNTSPLTSEQLKKDCLAYLSPEKRPVKASRLFMGHIHDRNNERLSSFYHVPSNSYKTIEVNWPLLMSYLVARDNPKVFFRKGVPEGYLDDSVNLSQFKDYSEAYHRLMFDLTLLNCESIELIMEKDDTIGNLYVTGGFARNELYVSLMACFYPGMEVFTSRIDNGSALGAALVIWDNLYGAQPIIDLGLVRRKPYQ